jgi:hypothetical protein
MTNTSPQTLLELLEHAPRSQTAIVLPDENVKVSYDSLRQQIHGVADAFASAGIKGGDLGNVAFNPISALTGGTLEELVRHPDVSALVRQIMVEPEALAARLGIELPISIEQRMAGAERWAHTRPRCRRISKRAARWSSRRLPAQWLNWEKNSACR